MPNNDPPRESGPREVSITINEGLQITEAKDSPAIYFSQHMKRKVKVYQVHENELNSIGFFNTGVTICGSIASAAAMYILTVLWDMRTVADELVAVCWVYIGVSVLVIIACAAIGYWCHGSKKSIVDKLHKESWS